ncbi:zinc finger protein 160-like [Pectinophora gossypiella]|nr:zinc finger protein 160-like [Pectinophora gossypiella]
METTTPCRCCLLRPPDKDLKAAYTALGKTEIYSDMLKECFEIHLHIGTTEGDSGICEVCITRLRDACEFKQQVHRCQKDFQLRAGDYHVKDETLKVKEEVTYPDETNEIVFMELKEEMSDYNDYQDEDDCKLAEVLCLRDVTVKRKSSKRSKKRLLLGEKTDRKSKKLTIPRLRRISKIEIKSPLKLASSVQLVNLSENKKHKVNIENILKYSNCTPFSNKNLSGIVCAYCKEAYPDLAELRTHIQTSHKSFEFAEKCRDKSNISIKMDITDLKCCICDAKFDIISNLKKHLVKEHDIKFYPDVNDYILEFKLTQSETLNCALCNSTFETFKMLLQHMNGHYRNYICEVCDLGFINKHRLKNHQRTHEIGDFQCSFCEKVFTTRVRKMCHEKYTHNTNARYTTNCPHCNESFNSYYQRNRHMFKEHNTVAATYKCNICEKNFILKSKLTSHIKKVHLMERNHICPECGQGFFIKQSLDEHMIKHNGERVFKCTVCLKAYARKKTLREHMRIHNNDRRFKCGVCDLAFVQKCSLKSHMLSNHGITLAEFENAKELSRPISVT